MASLEQRARAELPDAHSFLFFDGSCKVLASSFKANPAELKPLVAVLGDRAAAVRSGMVVDGHRYEVHRHHPPLVYGRTMGAHDPEDSVGAALCAVADATATGQPCYGFITYRMPNLSARMVPLLEAFCERHLRPAADGVS
ncbi:hypothetical protein Rsub_12531 [Raphidocelis subcapitata]|uniref:Uncharacterized protein n=1 Tax=Raphidocelis subcapitata TaxID=307507 RepID=A0A2V0PJ69_9CHLO|nr:hypothetical protein Rsub_12531 [Raphidocelis subcapitata]|eukprot:GBF99756.1 hypothetical protein Rsub_12531 [Raphidocelis subcapitata]